MSGYTALVTLHLLVIALGIGFSTSNFINTRLALSQGPDVAKGLALHRSTIVRYADIVIALIWITGVWLWWMRGFSSVGGAFHAKLTFVVLLTLFHGAVRAIGGRMQRTGNMALLPKLSLAVGGVALTAVAALVCAEIAFRG